MATTQRPDPPYLAIAAEIRSRIESGELGPGDRVPSIRQITQRWGVAVATATRAAAVLREEGLVEPRIGAGTVVSARAARELHGREVGLAVPGVPGSGPGGGATKRLRLLHAAIAIADIEGIDAVTMRRVATYLGVGPMSLYQSVANKEELLMKMADHAFGEVTLRAEGLEGWRAKLEHVARAEWELCRRHLWLPRTVSFTRPSYAPNMMAHTEWVLRALDGLGLSMETRMREAQSLHSIALSAAASVADEEDAEHSTGLTLDRWRRTQRVREGGAVDGTHFPLIAKVPRGVAEDLEKFFEYNLATHLDGFSMMLAGSSCSSS